MNSLVNILNGFGADYGGILALVGLIGIAFTVISFFRKDTVSLRYVITSGKLIHDHQTDYSKLEIKYDGREIRNLTASRIILFNEGRVTLRDTDIPAGKFLGVKLKDGALILDANIVDTISDNCQFGVEILNDSECKVGFHHINPKNAVLIHILHEGTSSDDVSIIGTGAGLNKIRKSVLEKEILTSALGVGLLAFGAWYIFYFLYSALNSWDLVGYVLIAVCLAMAFLASILTIAWVECLQEIRSYFWLRKLLKKI